MDSTERISQLSHRIFNTTLTEKRVGRSSNPFATPSFTGQIISADTFEKDSVSFGGVEKLSMKDKAVRSIKRTASAFVSGITSIGDKFMESMSRIKDFGIGIKDGFVSAWHATRDVLSTDVGALCKNGFSKISDSISEIQSSMSLAPFKKKVNNNDVAANAELLACFVKAWESEKNSETLLNIAA